MADPPLLAGAVNVTLAVVLPAVALPMVGAPGAVAAVGVTLFDSADAALDPTLLTAWTWIVRATPADIPAKTIGLEAPDCVSPVDAVAIYPVMADPPSLAGAVNVTLAEPIPAVAAPMVGAPGAVAGAATGRMAAMMPIDGVAVACDAVRVPVAPATALLIVAMDMNALVIKCVIPGAAVNAPAGFKSLAP